MRVTDVEQYIFALEKGLNCLKDSDLQSGTLVRNWWSNAPLCVAGDTSVVFKIQAKHFQVALKVFTQDVPLVEKRYKALRSFFYTHSDSALLRPELRDGGLRIGGVFYPVVRMPWVEGSTLREFVRLNIEKPSLLLAIARELANCAERFCNLKFVHGSVSPDNIIVDEHNQLKFVDYDYSFSSRVKERLICANTNVNAYTHPRTAAMASDVSPTDNYGFQLLYTCLVVLAYQPELLRSADELVFSADDLKYPEKSAIFQMLLAHPIGVVQDCCKNLIASLKNEPHKVAALSCVQLPSAVSSIKALPNWITERLAKSQVKNVGQEEVVAQESGLVAAAAPEFEVEALLEAAPEFEVEALSEAAPESELEALLEAAPESEVEALLEAAPESEVEALLAVAPESELEASPAAAQRPETESAVPPQEQAIPVSAAALSECKNNLDNLSKTIAPIRSAASCAERLLNPLVARFSIPVSVALAAVGLTALVGSGFAIPGIFLVLLILMANFGLWYLMYTNDPQVNFLRREFASLQDRMSALEMMDAYLQKVKVQLDFDNRVLEAELTPTYMQKRTEADALLEKLRIVRRDSLRLKASLSKSFEQRKETLMALRQKDIAEIDDSLGKQLQTIEQEFAKQIAEETRLVQEALLLVQATHVEQDLRGRSISTSAVMGIDQTAALMLRFHGVVTACDVDAARLNAIDGLKLLSKKALLYWREYHEKQARLTQPIYLTAQERDKATKSVKRARNTLDQERRRLQSLYRKQNNELAEFYEIANRQLEGIYKHELLLTAKEAEVKALSQQLSVVQADTEALRVKCESETQRIKSLLRQTEESCTLCSTEMESVRNIMAASMPTSFWRYTAMLIKFHPTQTQRVS